MASTDAQLVNTAYRFHRFELRPATRQLPRLYGRDADLDALLVLDNCEHLLDDVSAFVDARCARGASRGAAA